MKINIIIIILIFYKCYINAKDNKFYKLPKFWTNTGFSPISESVSDSLLTNDMRIHLNLIGSLPNRGISSIRIHWLLDLINYERNDKKMTNYNFEKLDKFLKWIDEAGLNIGFEMMGKSSEIFQTNFNSSMLANFWENLSFQILQRYLTIFGEDTIRKWKFESWNEPDLNTYNKLNFTANDFWIYLKAMRKGFDKVLNKFSFRGPGGLFKNRNHHPICWTMLFNCQQYPVHCPFNILTFHRKGMGKAEEILSGEENLLLNFSEEFPNLRDFPFSNDEADPIAGWSTPRPFQADIRYAIIVVKNVMEHWSAMLNKKLFYNLESISHDNAFFSYHPYEFDQRTLFARFQMNQSNPIYSQFIAKPVFSALGMLSNLGDYAQDISIYSHNITILSTHSNSSYFAIITVMPDESTSSVLKFEFDITNEIRNSNETFAYCLEVLGTSETNPAKIWENFGRPSYPNEHEREQMRKIQTPQIILCGISPSNSIIKIEYELAAPWIALSRICSSANKSQKPINLRIFRITNDEIMIFWHEPIQSRRCVKTYLVEFKQDKNWLNISNDQHVPFLWFQYQIKNANGFYRVTPIDFFGRFGPTSDELYFSQ